MNSKSMNAPKILPWIARKAGISDELALKVWRRALSETEYLTGRSEGSDYWKMAVERFLQIVEDESDCAVQNTIIPGPQTSWLWRHQTRMSLLTLMAAQNTYRYWEAAWENLAPKKAA